MSTVDLRALLERLRADGVELWAQDGRLRYRPEGALAPETLATLSQHKTALIDELASPELGPGPLVAGPRPPTLPLSYGQEGLWYLDQIGAGVAYNVARTFRIDGDLDEEILRRAVDELVRRHEVLRTRYAMVDGAAAQVVVPTESARWDLVDLSGLPTEEAERQGLARVRAHCAMSFDLASENAFAVQVVRLGPEVHLLNVNVHHILIDAASFAILMGELDVLYRAFAAGQPSPLPELPAQYADYALWQRRRLDGGLAAAQLAYWRDRLAGTPGSLDLPFDHVRLPVPDHSGRMYTFPLPPTLAASLQALARQHDTTRFTVLLAAFVALLSRWSAQRDLCVGVPVDSRGHVDAEQLVGYFLNPVVLRAELGSGMTFTALLRQVHQRLIEAYDHRDLPFDQLVAALCPGRDLSRQPLFQVAFAAGEGHGPPPSLGDLTVRDVEIADDTTAKFDLTMFAGEGPDGVSCSFEYATSLFGSETIERLAGHLVTLLGGVVADPATPVGELPLLTEGERHQLQGWNATASPYRQDLCLHQLVEEQVRRTPTATAAVCGERSITYDELNRQANRWARRLRELGVGPGRPVAVYTDRSLDMVVALLAVLKAGAAYLPLDAAYPQARLAYMLNDSRAPVILTQTGLVGRLGDHQAAVLCLDADAPAVASQPDTDPEPMARPTDLVWCLYTSGSTGRPKGVMVEHRSAVAFMHWSTRAFSRADLERVLLCSSLNYDPSAFELFTPLAVGGTVVVVDDALALCAPSAAPDPTLVSTVPSAARALVEADAVPQVVRAITLGGEPARREVVDGLRRIAPQARIYNIYGPTETTIVVTAGEVAAAGPVTIGRPLTNSQIHILDDQLAPVPVGVPGELYIAGDGLARGYWDAPALTADRFLPNPFGLPGSRMYHTGDLARYRADGTITFLGRVDDQVKVRGYRIELGEVENALLQCDDVADAAVVVHEDATGDRRLVGHVVGRRGPVDPDVLRAQLRHVLPEFMVPSSFVELNALPTTPNGKTDRGALPGMTRAGDDGDGPGSAAPRTPTEQALVRLWQEILGTNGVGVHDNFFRLGGHSLLAVRLVVRAREAVQADIALADFLAAPTVAALARLIDAGDAGDSPAPGAAGSDPFTVLLPLRAGHDTPLFCVHPVIGLSLCYMDLAQQLPPGIPVFGLQARGLAGPEPLPPSIEAMAEDYVAQVRAVQPSGPYRLLGWSLGGCVAHAMAALLQRDGEEVDLLALVDSYFAAPGQPGADVSQAEAEAGTRVLVRRHLAADTVSSLGDQRLVDVERISANNVLLLARFRPGLFRGDVQFFASREDEDHPGYLRPEMWAAHVTGHLDIHASGHGHYELMGPEPAAAIGQVIARRLQHAGMPLNAS